MTAWNTVITWLAAVLLVATPAFAGGKSSPKPPAPPKVDLSALADTAVVQKKMPDGKDHPVKAHLITDKTSAVPGETLRLGLYLVQKPEWHTYWKSPGDIGLPTEITWAVPEGTKTTSYQYPVPQRFEDSGIVSFGYDDQVLLFTEVTVPEDASGELALGAKASWLVCKSSCIPGDAELSTTVPVGDGAASDFAPLFEHFAAQHPVRPLTVEAFAVEGALSHTAVKPNETFKAAWLIAPTGEAKLGELPEDGHWPTFTPIVGYDWMVNSITAKSTDKGILVVLEGEAFEPDPLPKDATIGGLFQVKVGDELVKTEVLSPMPWVGTDGTVEPSKSPLWNLAGVSHDDPPPPENGNGGGGEEAPAESASAPAPAVDTSISAGLTAVGLAFLGGLLLNIMPCVLPVLMLKLYGLVEQAEATASEQKIAGLAYTGGILVSFWALAGIVFVVQQIFGLQVGWGFQFQYPAYVAALATIVFGFGLSLFGVFEIPAFGIETANEASSREGPVGYFFTGVFAVLVATPCTAPMMGPALGFAFAAPAAWLFLTFTALGLGLAFPFFVVAFLPAAFQLLPQPGEWMDAFKQFLGFTLMATTAWLVGILSEQVGPERAGGFLWFLVFVALGAWVFGRWGGLAASAARRIGALAVAGGIAVSAGFYFLDLEMAEAAECDDGELAEIGEFADEIPWQSFSEDRVAAASGKTVFIDFTAEWCLTCKANEAAVLETSTVRTKMDELGVVPLKADWTRRDPVITTWLERYNRAGVPFYLVIPADGSDNIPLPEVITPQMVVDALEQGSS